MLLSFLQLVFLGLSLFSVAQAHTSSYLGNQARHKSLVSRSRAHHYVSAKDVDASILPLEPAVVKRVAPSRRAVKRSCAAVSSSLSSSASGSVTSSAVASASSTTAASVSQGNDGISTVEVTSTSTRYETVYSSPPAAATSSVSSAANNNLIVNTDNVASSSTVAAVTSSVIKATTTSSSAAAATTTATVSTVDPDGAGPFSGDATWFDTGLGACGWTNVASDHIVAVSQLLFDSWPGYAGTNPNNNPICGQAIRVTLPSAGTTIDVTVADRCEGCAERDLDFTSGGFEDLVPGGLDVGRIGMTWEWI